MLLLKFARRQCNHPAQGLTVEQRKRIPVALAQHAAATQTVVPAVVVAAAAAAAVGGRRCGVTAVAVTRSSSMQHKLTCTTDAVSWSFGFEFRAPLLLLVCPVAPPCTDPRSPMSGHREGVRV